MHFWYFFCILGLFEVKMIKLHIRQWQLLALRLKHRKWITSKGVKTIKYQKTFYFLPIANWYHFFIFVSVATKIENGPKTTTKILRFLKMDRRRIRRIFINSKILRRSSKIANSSNIFEDTKIFKGKWKIFVVKNFLSGSNLDKFSQQ